MNSTKKINFTVRKEYNYQPITKDEKQRITKLLAKKILSIANRFDGSSTFEIHISAKGNA